MSRGKVVLRERRLGMVHVPSMTGDGGHWLNPGVQQSGRRNPEFSGPGGDKGHSDGGGHTLNKKCEN